MGHFGFTWAHSGVTLRSLWVHFGSPGVHFGDTLTQLYGHFGVTVMTLWVLFDDTLTSHHFGVTRGSFEGHLEATKKSLWGLFGFTLGSLRVTIGSLWDFLRVTLWSLWGSDNYLSVFRGPHQNLGSLFYYK